MPKLDRKFVENIFSRRATLIAFAIFVLSTFLMGGGSRHDTASIIVLRPLAAGMLVYALLAIRPSDAATIRPVIWWFVAATVLVAVQLIPLPTDLWASLAGREPYAQLLAASGADQVARPVTMSPSKTYNAFFSLIVPIAGIALFASLGKERLHWVPRLILVAALVSAILALLQIAGTPGGPLYFYRLTNEADGVGLFANRNHNAVFLAGAIPIAAAVAALDSWLPDGKKRRPRSRLISYSLFLPILVLFVLAILSSGSRAGLLVAGPMIVAAAIIFGLHAASERRKEVRTQRKTEKWAGLRDKFWIAPLAGAAVGLVIALLSGRAGAIERLFSEQTSDLRFNVLPTLLEMLGDFFPIGAGFGSFTHIYPQYEQDELLGPQYLNQAHNDWLQVLIEGGLVAGALQIVAVLALAGLLLFLLFTRAATIENRLMALSFLFFSGCIGVASLVDYPARSPSIMLTLALAFCMAFHVRNDARTGSTQSLART